MNGFTKEEKEKFIKSVERFNKAMENCDRKGQVITINFKKGIVIKSKCRKGRKAA